MMSEDPIVLPIDAATVTSAEKTNDDELVVSFKTDTGEIQIIGDTHDVRTKIVEADRDVERAVQQP